MARPQFMAVSMGSMMKLHWIWGTPFSVKRIFEVKKSDSKDGSEHVASGLSILDHFG